MEAVSNKAEVRLHPTGVCIEAPRLGSLTPEQSMTTILRHPFCVSHREIHENDESGLSKQRVNACYDATRYAIGAVSLLDFVQAISRRHGVVAA